MSTQPPENDPFRKEPPPSGSGGGGSPYDGSSQPPPYGPGPYGPEGYGGGDPLAGMPPLGSFGRRFLARLIDLLIVTVPLTLISLPFGGADVTSDGGDDFNDFVTDLNSSEQWVWTLITAVALVLYDWLMVRNNGQTLGKRLLGLRVAMLSDGSTPDSNASLARAAVLLLPAWLCCPCLWLAIISVMILADKPYKQGLHDKAGKTVVVSTG
ncbi:RDD family protein [Streptomyces sp. GC420]|uniref:RDD family protein n=1 Tax=Streptomyces sp. GC420 TaxID=2697568 RepID=UPI0014150468|nr:RDD family protein [Streptomyces sp. GC420]NBM21102.1 RDD family protein [Streptomyces sp. GC420]